MTDWPEVNLTRHPEDRPGGQIFGAPTPMPAAPVGYYEDVAHIARRAFFKVVNPDAVDPWPHFGSEAKAPWIAVARAALNPDLSPAWRPHAQAHHALLAYERVVYGPIVEDPWPMMDDKERAPWAAVAVAVLDWQDQIDAWLKDATPNKPGRPDDPVEIQRRIDELTKRPTRQVGDGS